MADTYSIQKHIVKQFFTNIISGNNADAIIECLLRDLSSEQVNFIIGLNTSKEIYKELHIGQLVLVPMEDYHIDSKFHIDVLNDLNLIPKPGHIFGVITGTDSWRGYSSYSATLKLNLIYHNDSKKPMLYEHSVLNLSIIDAATEMSADEISEFFNKVYKPLKNGNNK